MNRNIPTDKVIVSRERILRAVASSSAIETGERTAMIEDVSNLVRAVLLN